MTAIPRRREPSLCPSTPLLPQPPPPPLPLARLLPRSRTFAISRAGATHSSLERHTTSRSKGGSKGGREGASESAGEMGHGRRGGGKETCPKATPTPRLLGISPRLGPGSLHSISVMGPSSGGSWVPSGQGGECGSQPERHAQGRLVLRVGDAGGERGEGRHAGAHPCSRWPRCASVSTVSWLSTRSA